MPKYTKPTSQKKVIKRRSSLSLSEFAIGINKGSTSCHSGINAVIALME